jgi:Ca2+-transporting ATPase
VNAAALPGPMTRDAYGGLTAAQAAVRLAADGCNELPTVHPPGLLEVAFRQLTDTVIVVLLVAAVLTALTGDLTDTVVILAVIVLNGALGTAQELRSSRAMAALAELTAPRATVVRDGADQDIDARDVVVGDLVRLAAGDIVPADGVLRGCQAMQVDEAMLTGESLPVAKVTGDALHAGTVLTRGRGAATVTAVAAATAAGGIASSLRATADTATPVQRQLAVLGRRLALVVALAAAVVGAISLASGHSVEISLVLAVSLAVAAIPESLPVVVALSLALGARRMAAQGALVRRLAAVESLGSVTVLAADKTGTLTTGSMEVTAIRELPAEPIPGLAGGLLAAVVLCNDAGLIGETPSGQRDDPTESALLRRAQSAGIDVDARRAQWPRVAEEPFDPETARMTTSHLGAHGTLVICKGAPESVLRPDLLQTVPEAARAEADELAQAGLRVLAVAAGPSADSLRLLGLVGLADPVRASARATLDAFRTAGVRPVMITGDHAATAAAVAAQLGIDPGDVYARVRPQEKIAVVAALQADGEVVAMTGDGVNDAPALRAADVGVAMGQRGTEVAKQSAQIVLTADDLSAMIPAIGEGRRVYDNLRRFLHYALSGGTAEILVMLGGPALGLTVPLQAGQILWMNLLTHGLPGVAMGNEPAQVDVLMRPPRPPGGQLLDARTGRRVALLGLVIAGCGLAAGLAARARDRPWQTMVFLTVTAAQLGVALALRPPKQRGGQRNRLLLLAVLVDVGLAVAAVWWPPLQALLHTASLSLRDALLCGVAALPAALVARLQVRDARRPLVRDVAAAG